MLTIETLAPDRLARISPALMTTLIEEVWLLTRAWSDADLTLTSTACGLTLTVAQGDRPVAGRFLPFDVAPCAPAAA